MVFGITACDDGSGDDGSISINGWKFSGYNDRNNGGTSTISISQDGNKLIVTGNLTENVPNDPWDSFGFSNFVITPNADLLSQLKASTGVYFDIIGDGKTYRFEVVTSNVNDGGYFGKEFTTQNGVKERISIPFSELSQPSWATSVSGDFNYITFLQISAHSGYTGVGPYSFTFFAELDI